MKLNILICFVCLTTAHATHLIDETPGGFVPSVTGTGDPPVYAQAQYNLHLDTADSSGQPWGFTGDGGLGGTYLFSNLFTISPTLNASVSWNLFNDPNHDWMTYLIVGGGGLLNIYGVDSSQKFESGSQIVTVNGTATIAAIAFMGRNPAFPTPESGSTFGMLAFVLIALCFLHKL